MDDFLKNKDLLKIWSSYDAYYFKNKYGEGLTHKEEFDNLYNLLKSDDLSLRALGYILHNYDCYYKNEYDEKNDNNPFYYLQYKLNELEGNKNEC